MKLHQLRIVLGAALLGVAGCAQQAPSVAETAPAAASPRKVTVGQEVGAALRNEIVVEFTSGSARLTPEANRQLDVAARLYRDVRPVKMFSVGYSDSAGEEYANLILAAQRARAVKAALISRGLPPDVVQLRSFGESDPIDGGDPSVAANRRVVVSWRIL